jgi:hypothetical protein
MARSVKDSGALGDGGADDTAAVQATVDKVQQEGGGVVLFPSGVYRVTANISSTTSGVVLRGEGVLNTRIMPDSNAPIADQSPKAIDFTPLSLSGQHCGIADVHIWPASRTACSGGSALELSFCFCAFVETVVIAECFNGVLVEASTETRLKKISLRSLRGDFGIKYTGIWDPHRFFGGLKAPLQSFRCVIEDVLADNPYPDVGKELRFRGNWEATALYKVGDVVFAANRIYVCKREGRSGSKGPSHVKGDGADGETLWAFGSGNITWIIQESYAYSLVIDKAALIGGARAFGMYDSADRRSPVESRPKWAFIWDLEGDHNYNLCVDLSGGEGVYINGSWLGSCLTGSGVFVGSKHKGEVSLSGGTRIIGNKGFGVLLAAGPKAVIINDCFIGVNGNNGVEVVAGATDFTITNNIIGKLPGLDGNDQPWGITINQGGSERYIVMGNNLTGNKIGCLSDGGRDQKIVSPNLCDFDF